MSVDTLPVDLGLDAAEAQARFDGLQEKLVPLWKSMERLTQDEQTIVVVCSMTLEDPNMPAAVLQAYEERFLFLLLLLRQPRARLVYVTSQAIHPSIVDYYLDLLPGVIPSHARQAPAPRVAARRLVAAAVREAPRAAAAARADPPARPRSRPRPPRPVQHDRAGARPRARARHPDVRRRPALLPATGRRPAAGGCSPSRACATRWAARTCRRRRSWRRRSASCARERPGMSQVIVKLNEGVSGEGNALLEPRRARRRRGHRRDRGAAAASCSSSCRRSRTTATRTCSRSAAASSRSGSQARSSAARASRCA